MREYPHRRELKTTACIAAITLIASCLPYAAGMLASSPELQFGGVLLLHREDVLSYLAAMQQGANGSWTFRILFTPEEHEGAPIYLFYLALGRIARMLGLPMAPAYHLARIAAGACELGAIYAFARRFVKSAPVRIAAYLLACAGGGLGWLIAIAQAMALRYGLPHPGWAPIDFWLVDAYTLPTILLFPHGALAVAIMLAAALSLLNYCQRGRWLIPTTLAALTLAIVQPICLGTLAAAAGAHLALLVWTRKARPRRRELAGAAAVGLTALAAAAYYRHIFAANPAFSAWQAQNLTPSPAPIHWLLGYGVILPPAAAEGIHILREKDEGHIFPVAWLLATGVLLYLPHTPQRRFAQGLIAPLSCLASMGLARWLGEEPFHTFLGFSTIASESRLCPEHNPPGRWITPRFALELVLTLAALSSITLISAHTRQCAGGEAVFHPIEELEAIQWLGRYSAPGDTVLASPEVGSFIPAYVGRRTFGLHWCETTDPARKARELAAFFDPTTPDKWRRSFLERYNIRYLFYGPKERALGAFDPERAPYLSKCHQQGPHAVYRVIGERR
ncbi:MAG TPA: hypothetical protein EYP09_04945 [Anaerolineae bacterium]|nr:hypothetical protein [Anaerolineae bacterium]